MGEGTGRVKRMERVKGEGEGDGGGGRRGL